MAVAGASMGGLGALAYAARHPGLFRAAASFSGITDTRLSAQESRRYVHLVRSQGQNPSRLWGGPRRAAAVWAAPNPDDLATRLRGTQLFLAAGTGQPGPLDPAGTAASTIESSPAAENAALARRLRALKIPAQLDFYAPGTHSWPYRQRDLHHAWPLLQHALGTRRTRRRWMACSSASASIVASVLALGGRGRAGLRQCPPTGLSPCPRWRCRGGPVAGADDGADSLRRGSQGSRPSRFP